MAFKYIKSVITFVSSILLLTSCNFNSSFKNDKDDKNEAEETTMMFYALLESKDYQKTYPFFSKRFLEVTDTTKLNQIYNTSVEKLGDVKNKHLQHWETNVVKGTNPISQYLLVYDVTRTKYHSIETIILEKENDTIKILGYNVKSDGFFAE